MSRLVKLVLLGLVLALVVAPVAAQDDGQDIIIDASFGQSIVNTLNPITYSSATESGLLSLMIPLLFTADPETAIIQPGVPGTFARDWTVSEDGTVITFELYDNYVWSDGTPVTAKDWEFVWDAVQSGQVETRLVFREPYVAEMTALDDYTLEVELLQPNCESIGQVPQLPFPSHLYRGEDGEVDWQAVSTDAFLDPSTFLSVGPYQLSALSNNEQVALVPLESFPAGENGNYETLNDGYVMKLVGSQTVVNEEILAGTVHFSDFVAPDARQAFIDSENLEHYEFVPGNTWDYFSVNHANPDNPMPAYDDDGNLQEQDPHPIFGDVRVRRALAHAINMDDVIEAALFGFGINMPTMYAPGTWVDPEIPAREFNQELALELLAEAGWVDDDDDPSTPLVATEDALYAEPGTTLTFDLVTNDGNTRRTAFGQIIQDQLSEIGIEVNFQTIDFNVILDMMDAQNYDSLILGWQNGYPYSPDMTQLFGSVSDTMAGNNFMSWVNTDFDALQLEALSVEGCDPEERAAIYAQAAQVAFDEAAYIVQFGTTGFFAWNAGLDNVDPYPANLSYNMTEWTFAP